ncbi:hypothetical protein DL95DRAFT_469797 [Leptodontidium sp. 2 PMI_412]|nr:hypothetical protein DL95DRAFT_469797 [Leptodontidium sp. 2 PMI_412]
MAITEFILPSYKQTPESIEAFSSIVGPYLQKILDEALFKPKQLIFGKLVLKNGVDVSADFRPCLGLEWEKPDHFYAVLTSEEFKAFGSVVKPYSAGPPNTQLYETNLGPSEVFGSALTEVWQVRVGDGFEREEAARGAWKRFMSAIGEASAVKRIQGASLNQQEKLWIGVLGWESNEVREKVLDSAAVKEAREGLDGLLWNTFVATFAQPSKL